MVELSEKMHAWMVINSYFSVKKVVELNFNVFFQDSRKKIEERSVIATKKFCATRDEVTFFQTNHNRKSVIPPPKMTLPSFSVQVFIHK